MLHFDPVTTKRTKKTGTKKAKKEELFPFKTFLKWENRKLSPKLLKKIPKGMIAFYFVAGRIFQKKIAFQKKRFFAIKNKNKVTAN